MPDGPETAPVGAATPNAPAPAPVPAPIPAPIIEAVPVRAVAAPQAAAATNTPEIPTPQTSTRPSSPTAPRTLASGDNAASAEQPKAPAYNTTNTDAEERAILESGWNKNQSSKQRPPWQ
jgi:hypothetical protein